jgi:hypothetical protein
VNPRLNPGFGVLRFGLRATCAVVVVFPVRTFPREIKLENMNDLSIAFQWNIICSFKSNSVSGIFTSIWLSDVLSIVFFCTACDLLFVNLLVRFVRCYTVHLTFPCEPMGRREIFHTFSLLVEMERHFTHEFVTCDYETQDWNPVVFAYSEHHVSVTFHVWKRCVHCPALL